MGRIPWSQPHKSSIGGVCGTTWSCRATLWNTTYSSESVGWATAGTWWASRWGTSILPCIWLRTRDWGLCLWDGGRPQNYNGIPWKSGYTSLRETRSGGSSGTFPKARWCTARTQSRTGRPVLCWRPSSNGRCSGRRSKTRTCLGSAED